MKLKETNIYKLITKIIPEYAFIPLIALFLFNTLTYYGTKVLSLILTNAGSAIVYHGIVTSFDEKIPLIPIFVIPYVVAYVQWVVGFIMISRESKLHCYRFIYGEIIAKAFTLITFLAFPTMMAIGDATLNDAVKNGLIIRPDNIEVKGLLSWIVSLVYAADTPINLFPSIHCLESLFCFFGCVSMKKAPLWYKISMGILTTLVCMSIVFVRQHVVADFFGALLYSLVAIGISFLIFKSNERNLPLEK